MADPLALDSSRTPVDDALVAGLVEWDDSLSCPYSHVGTLVAKVRTLFSYLVDVARERACTDHGAIARECDVHAARQGPVLRVLGHHEAARDRPLLPALVTKADRETPGEWYSELVERTAGGPDAVPDAPAERRWLWETQRDAVYRAWAERPRTPRADAPRISTP